MLQRDARISHYSVHYVLFETLKQKSVNEVIIRRMQYIKKYLWLLNQIY